MSGFNLKIHLIGFVLAILLVALSTRLYDEVRGAPQGPILTKDEGYTGTPGGTVRIRYFSVKSRNCPFVAINRFFYELGDDGARTGRAWAVAPAEDIPPTGKADMGRQAPSVLIRVPAFIPPGQYEYVAEIDRQCVPMVGRVWKIQQQPAAVTVLPKPDA